jgi:hypothetical protein
MDLDIETPDVTLTTPVYNVTRIKLISARVPNSQLLINQYNNTYVHQGTTYSVPLGTYTTGEDLASVFTDSGPVSAVYNANTHALTFSDAFEPGPWLSEILGYPGGVIDLNGPRYITLRLAVGSDVLSRAVYPIGTDCHYFGKILTGPIGEIIRYTDSFDTIEMATQIKTITSFHIDFLNPDGSVCNLGGGYILKLRLECSTDKMFGTVNDTVTKDVLTEEPMVRPDNHWILIVALVALTLGLLMLL